MWLRTGLWCGPFVMALCLLTQSAHAQTNEKELGRANRLAMETFSRLEVPEARAQLETAAQNARAAGVRGPALARTFANLGVVLVGGLNDNAAGLVAFKQALEQDPSVVVDPLFNAPNIEQVFALAKKASSKGAPAAGDSPQNQPKSGPARFESTLLHAPAPEQLTQTAVPVYVANAELGAVKMRISYRGLGMPAPKTAEMQRTKDGFAFLIPCSMVFEPRVEYWIDALDEAGKTVGYAGKADAPIAVPIVAQRSRPAPALPGQPAPAQCGTDECPPGMPGCEDVGDGSAGLGDTCHTNGDCSEGLACRDDFCSLADGESAGSGTSGASDSKRFFVDVGFSLGLAPVGAGHKADAPPPKRVTTEAGKRPPDERLAYVRGEGWACKSRPSAVNPGSTELYDCNVHVVNSGLVPTLAVHLSAGYRFNPKLYAAVMGRIQIARGEGTLAGVLLGARGGYVLLDQGVKGFGADVFAGLGVGQIQPQVVDNGPYAVSGTGAFELGGRALYQLTESLGLVLSPHAFIMFPTFLMNLDITAGAQLAF